MTCYLTDNVDPGELGRGYAEGVWVAAKLYPAGATTNSDSGVTDVANIRRALSRMEDIGMPLLVHGEVTDPAVDVFDREAVFIDRVLDGLVRDFPALKVVFEHITTRQAAEFVADAPATVAATITPQHLHLNATPVSGGFVPRILPAGGEARGASLRCASAAVAHRQIFLARTEAAARDARNPPGGGPGIFNAPFAASKLCEVFGKMERSISSKASHRSWARF